MTDQTHHLTQQDLRKAESKASQSHGGNPPQDSTISAAKSMVDQTNNNKNEQIEAHKSNLPLPEDPPATSDWSSANQSTVGVGSGAHRGPLSGQNDTSNELRGPSTAVSGVREDGAELHKNTEPTGNVGRQAKENLGDIPQDALAR